MVLVFRQNYPYDFEAVSIVSQPHQASQAWQKFLQIHTKRRNYFDPIVQMESTLMQAFYIVCTTTIDAVC